MADLYNQLVSSNPMQYGQVEQNEWMNNPLNDVAVDVTWDYVPVGLGAYKGAKIFGKPVLNYGKGLVLSYGKPLFRLFDKSLNKFGKLGKEYYNNNIYPYKDYNSFIDDYVYYPNRSAGKPFYRYRDQYPTLRKNIRDSKEGLYIDAKPKYDKFGNPIYRNDATGFNNLKVNFRGKNYAYQIKKNPKSNRNEFYNIKPYELTEKDYQEQYFNKLFKNLLDDDY